MKTKTEGIKFLPTALDFFEGNWDSDEKCTQKKISERLGVSSSYLSKAKQDNDYARNLKRNLIALVKELGGTYCFDENAFFDGNNNSYPVDEGETPKKIHVQKGVVSPLLLEELSRTNNLYLLMTWTSESCGQLIRKFEENPKLFLGIKNVKLLLLHPNSICAKMRSRELSEKETKGFGQIIEDLEKCVRLPKRIKNNIEVKLYRELPNIRLILCDDLYSYGHYLNNNESSLGHQIMFDPKSDNHKSMAKELRRHFFNIWKNAETFDLESGGKILEQWKAPSYQGYNKEVYDQFIGCHKIYYAQMESDSSHIEYHKTLATIGCGILEIYKNKSGEFKCRFKHEDTTFSETMYGKLIHEGLDNKNILILELKNKSKEQYLKMYFNIRNGKKGNLDSGSYTFIHGNSGKIGNGRALLCPSTKDYEALYPENLQASQILMDKKNKHLHNLGIEGIAYLSNKKNSLLIPESPKENVNHRMDFSGTFKLYSFRKNNSDSSQHKISIAVLEILSSGSVRFKNRIGGFECVGWANKKQGNLYIRIKNSNKNVSRSALFIFKTGINPHPTEKKLPYFYGASVSTTWSKEMPVGAKVILEHCPKKKYDDTTPIKINSDSKDFLKIPECIREKLSDKNENYVGFFE